MKERKSFLKSLGISILDTFVVCLITVMFSLLVTLVLSLFGYKIIEDLRITMILGELIIVQILYYALARSIKSGNTIGEVITYKMIDSNIVHPISTENNDVEESIYTEEESDLIKAEDQS